jgi:hypothetical protein
MRKPATILLTVGSRQQSSQWACIDMMGCHTSDCPLAHCGVALIDSGIVIAIDFTNTAMTCLNHAHLSPHHARMRRTLPHLLCVLRGRPNNPIRHSSPVVNCLIIEMPGGIGIMSERNCSQSREFHANYTPTQFCAQTLGIFLSRTYGYYPITSGLYIIQSQMMDVI